MRTVVFKLGHFSAIFIFTAYCKASRTSVKYPAAPTSMKDTPRTDTLARTNPPVDKYIVMSTFYLNFFAILARSFVYITKLCCRFSPQPSLHLSQNLQKFNIAHLINNQFIFMIPT